MMLNDNFVIPHFLSLSHGNYCNYRSSVYLHTRRCVGKIVCLLFGFSVKGKSQNLKQR